MKFERMSALLRMNPLPSPRSSIAWRDGPFEPGVRAREGYGPSEGAGIHMSDPDLIADNTLRAAGRRFPFLQ